MAFNFEKDESLKDSILAKMKRCRVEEINTFDVAAEEGDTLNQKEVISLFEEISVGNNGQYYVGITGRIREREKEHNAHFLVVIDCLVLDLANELEELAKANGFYTGVATGNGHDDDTTKLYIYKIIPGVTIEG